MIADASNAVDRQHGAKAPAPQDVHRQRLHEHRADRRRAGQQAGLQRIRGRSRSGTAAAAGTASRRGRCGTGFPATTPCQNVGTRNSRRSMTGCSMRRACRTYASSAAAPATMHAAVIGSGQQVTAERRESEHQHARARRRTARSRAGRTAGWSSSRTFGMWRSTRKRPRMPIGMLMRKIQRQWKYSVIAPPSAGPITGPSSAGNRQVVERGDVVVLRHRAHQHEASHRHHHRPADALQEARDDERVQACPTAAHSSDPPMNTTIAAANTRARAVAVGHPAADRDEDGEAHEIGRQRELERERALADVRRDRRQRRRDDRRVHVLHEQRAGDDQRDEDWRVASADVTCRADFVSLPRRPRQTSWVTTVFQCGSSLTVPGRTRQNSHRFA